MSHTSLRPLPRSDDPRLRAVVEWERWTSAHRPRVRDDVREAAYDKAVDALLKDDTLGASVAASRGLAERCLNWKIAEDLRGRFTADGDLRLVPRAAQSFDQPLGDANGGTLAETESVAGPSVEELVHWRIAFAELTRPSAAESALPQDAVFAYLTGGAFDEVAARHGVTVNSVHQAKRRFVARNADLA